MNKYTSLERSKLNKIAMYIATDLIPSFRIKNYLIKKIGNNEIGKEVLITLGCEVYDSKIGDECWLGFNSKVENATLEERVSVGINASVSNCNIGFDTIIAAGARVTVDVPPASIVKGINIIEIPLQPQVGEELYLKTRGSDRNVTRIEGPSDTSPYYWTRLVSILGFKRIVYIPVHHIALNALPRILKSNKLKKYMMGKFCNINKEDLPTIEVHYSSIIDPILPELINIGRNAKIGEECVLLTHTFLRSNWPLEARKK